MNCVNYKENCCESLGSVQLLQREYDKILNFINRNDFNHKQFGEIHFVSTKDNKMCPFVQKGKCIIHDNRPWVCRAFPVVRRAVNMNKISLCYSGVCSQVAENINNNRTPDNDIPFPEEKEMVLYELAFSLANEMALFRMLPRMIKRYYNYIEKVIREGLQHEIPKKFYPFAGYPSYREFQVNCALSYAIACEGPEVVSKFILADPDTRPIIIRNCVDKHFDELETHEEMKKLKLNDLGWKLLINKLNALEF